MSSVAQKLLRGSVLAGMLLLACMVTAEPALAQIENPLGNTSFRDILVRLTNWLLGLVGMLSLIGVVMSGIRMIAAFGDEQQVASAKKILMWSIAGLAVSALALTIINIIVENVLRTPEALYDSLSVTTSVHAQVPAGDIKSQIGELEKETGLKTLSAYDVIVNIVNYITQIAAVIAMLVLVAGGFMIIISLGDEQRVAKGKKMVFYSLIGLLVMGVAYVLIAAVQGIIQAT